LNEIASDTASETMHPWDADHRRSARLGFLPSEHVHFSVDYITRHIVIRQAFD